MKPGFLYICSSILTLSFLLSSPLCLAEKKEEKVSCLRVFKNLNPMRRFKNPVSKEESRLAWKIEIEGSIDIPNKKNYWVVRTEGSGFFISPKFFVTNFHVIKALSEFDDIKKETLIEITQDGENTILHPRRIVYLSLLNDVAVLETKEEVSNYLSLSPNKVEEEKHLMIVGYPNGELSKANKLFGLKKNTIGKNKFEFNIDQGMGGGASGSPVLNENHEAVGMFSMASRDREVLFYSTKDLKNFLLQNSISQTESQEQSAKEMRSKISQELERMRNLAKEGGSIDIQFAVGMLNSRNTISWGIKCFKLGFPPFDKCFIARDILLKIYE